MAPKISVILPIYNSAKYLSRALDSVLDQTYEDWELLAVNDCGSRDGSADIVRVYERKDPRIKLVQNEQRLGLAESLNKGFRLAKGEYLARLDADDIARPDRFAKQVAFMDAHPDIGVCGTYQRHFGAGKGWVHRPPEKPEDMKAALLFHCNICHSTLMLRRSVFVEQGLFYDGGYYAEDFELWSRAILVTKFATIPEVLGEYRQSRDSITAAKKAALIEESGRIVAATLKRTLDMDLTAEQARFFQSWERPFKNETSPARRQRDLKELEKVLRQIYARNRKVRAFAPLSLLNAIAAEWDWAARGGSRRWDGSHPYKTLHAVFAARVGRVTDGEGWKSRVKRVLRRPAGWGRRVFRALSKDVAEENRRQLEALEEKIDALSRQVRSYEESRLGTRPPRFIPWVRGEQIRVGLLLQDPSDWLSMESLWAAMKADGRFAARLYVAGTKLMGPEETAAAALLRKEGVSFTPLERYTLLEDRPHVLVRQMAHGGEQPDYLEGDKAERLGVRTVYLSDTAAQTPDELAELGAGARAWRWIVLSEAMGFDYICRAPLTGEQLLPAGHPRFDGLSRREAYPLPEAVAARVGGRRLVYMQLRTPADAAADIPYASIETYAAFLERAGEYEDLFFLVRMEPEYLAYYEKRGLAGPAAALRRALEETENVRWYEGTDDRPALCAAECVIGDRCLQLLEAAALDVPTLYMSNFYYKETLLPSVAAVHSGLYQGSTAYDIRFFLDFVVSKGNDHKRQERRDAAAGYLPAPDGKNGERVAQAIAEAVYGEAGEHA